MPQIVSTHDPVGRPGYFSGRLFWTDFDFSDPVDMPFPFGSSRINARTSKVAYNSRQYQVGGHDTNVLIDEHRRVLRMGIPAPSSPPTLAVGAGAIEQIPYARFRDALTGEVGPISEGGALVTGNTTQSWSALPVVVPEDNVVLEGTVTLAAPGTTITGVGTRFDLLVPGDRISLSGGATQYATVKTVVSETSITVDTVLPAGASQTINLKAHGRVTHVDLLISFDGGLPRVVGTRQLGAATASTSETTLTAGEAAGDDFERFPRCSMNTTYHDRQAMAGDEKHRDTVYLSLLFFMERFGGLSIKTRNGDPITALIQVRDMLLITTHDSSYVMTGYSEDDIQLQVSEPQLGCFSHHAWQNIHGDAFISNAQGKFRFNGAWQNILVDRLSEYQSAYKNNRVEFENCYSVHNPLDSTYRFHPKAIIPSDPDPEPWICHYGDMVQETGGNYSQPYWTNDNSSPAFAAYLKDPNTGVGKLYVGECDGNVYYENEDAINAADALLAPAHLIFQDPGGPKTEGKRLTQFWSYVKSEESAWMVDCVGGDEYARPSESGDGGLFTPPTPLFRDEIAASEMEDAGTLHTPKTVHYHYPTKVQGRGFTFIYRFIAPLHAKFIGLGGTYIQGPATRPVYGLPPA